MIFKATPDWPYQISAGGVVVRGDAGQRQFALLYRKDDRRFNWHLPKGLVEDGESLEQAALREVREESGLVAKIRVYLGSTLSDIPPEVEGYPINTSRHYFLMDYVNDAPEGMDKEHDRIQWCTYEEALAHLKDSPKQEAEIVRRAKTWLNDRAA